MAGNGDTPGAGFRPGPFSSLRLSRYDALTMPRPTIPDQLVRLLRERHQLSMRDAFTQIALLHERIKGQGYELALEGHYRKAFRVLQQQPRYLHRRMDAALCRYVIALYSEQLLETEGADDYFATAYHELFAVIDLIHERYGYAWIEFPDLQQQLAFFDAVTALTSLEHQRLAHAFYNRPYVLPQLVLKPDFEYRLRPPQTRHNRPTWFPRPLPAPPNPTLS